MKQKVFFIIFKGLSLMQIKHQSFWKVPDLSMSKSTLEAFFVSFVNFYQQTFLAIFYLILLHLSYLIMSCESQ